MHARAAARCQPGGRFFVAVLLLAAGCTTLQSDRLDQWRDLPASAELTEVAFFAQDAYQCGPAALATVLTSAQIAVTPEMLVPEVYLPERRGSLQPELLAAARRHGTVAYVLKPELGALLTEVAAGRPVMVLQNLALPWYPKWHYAVVVGFDIARGEIVLRSGLERRHVVPLATFERTWRRGNYWAVVVAAPGQLPATADELPYLQSVLGLERLGNFTGAAAAYDAALARWPDSIGALIGLGNARYALGDFTAAEQAFRRATAAHPDAGTAFNNLAATLARQGRWAEAEAAAEHAIALGGPLLANYRETLSEIKQRRLSAP